MNINKYLQSGKSINVSADAGTGKTWVIISKILRLLLDNVNPEKITAITFTKKASAEMTERLNNKIELWSKLNDEDLKKELEEIGIKHDNNKYIKKAKKLFIKNIFNTKEIRICTFDSLFSEILLQFNSEKDILSSYTVNSTVESKIISDAIEKKIFNQSYFENNLNFKKNFDFLVDSIGSYENIKKSISSVIEKKSYFLEIIDNHKRFIEENEDLNKIKENLKITLIIQITKKIEDENLKKHFSDLYKFLLNDNFDNNIKVENIYKNFFTTARTVRKNTENKLIKYNSNIEVFINEVYHYEECVFNEIQKAWKFLAKTFFKEYQDYLHNNRLCDFSDKTWLCYKKLSELEDNNWIFYKIANSIDHLLIDEFQDTNFIQWKIIKIILESIENISDSHSLTIVGDSKQSIYGFRGSEPKLFEICKKFSNEKFSSKNIELKESRRSSKSIVSYVNKIFPNVSDFSTKIKNDGDVRIFNLSKMKLNEDPNNIKEKVILESTFICKQITDLVKNEDIKFSDIIILVRNRTHIKDMEEVLIKNSIPVYTNQSKSLLDNREIIDLHNLLKFLILEDRNAFELHSLLISPIFNYSIEEINKQNLNSFSDLENLILKSKYGNCIKKWRASLGYIPIHDLLDKIYNDLDLINLYRTNNSVKNEEINNNFLSYLNMSLKMNNGRYITPFHFLNEIEKTKDFKHEIESAKTNCVKILTIHAAKGLESKVVIIAQSYRKKETDKDYLHVLANEDLSCKDIVYYPSIFKNNFIIENYLNSYKIKSISEEDNLLYVACTRAKEILIINGFTEKRSWFTDSLFFE